MTSHFSRAVRYKHLAGLGAIRKPHRGGSSPASRGNARAVTRCAACPPIRQSAFAALRRAGGQAFCLPIRQVSLVRCGLSAARTFRPESRWLTALVLDCAWQDPNPDRYVRRKCHSDFVADPFISVDFIPVRISLSGFYRTISTTEP